MKRYLLTLPDGPAGACVAFESMVTHYLKLRLFPRPGTTYEVECNDPEPVAEAAFQVFPALNYLGIMDMETRNSTIYKRQFKARRTGDDR